MRFPKQMTFGEKYGLAMAITDQADADAYFEKLFNERITSRREEAERIERSNLGYFAGYYDTDTRIRIEQLFRCAHPIFGAIAKP